MDLLIFKNGERWGFEVKYCDAPRLTKSMQLATELLDLKSLTIVYPGKQSYRLTENIHVTSLNEYFK